MGKVPFHKDFHVPTAKERKEAIGTFPHTAASDDSRRDMLLLSAQRGQPSLQEVSPIGNGISVASIPSSNTRNPECSSSSKDIIDLTFSPPVTGNTQQKVLNQVDEATSNTSSISGSPPLPKLALSDLNDPSLYIPTVRSETTSATPQPADTLDWLAQVPEEGQTFDQYVTALSTRRTGRIKPLANAEGVDILLLPILRTRQPRGKQSIVKSSLEDSGDGKGDDRAVEVEPIWPSHGPPLEPLVQYTSAFFDRHVHLLPPALIYAPGNQSTTTSSSNNTSSSSSSRKKRKKNDSSSLNMSFASSTTKGNFKLFFPQADGATGRGKYVNVAGRRDFHSDRIQLKVDSLLDELSAYRYNRMDTFNGLTESHSSKTPCYPQIGKEFCIMGITMEDLYDGPKDLFCAGMAFGGDKVAVFSFARYHPFLKMHPLHWHHYGYTQSCDGYSYYEDDNQNPNGLKQDPPPISKMKKDDIAEFLRRSSKLLTHELGHLYVLDHCIHNKCLMMGTGHLVEDFKAPSHLCGVCLRKLQWRVGFDVINRYKLLAQGFRGMGMIKEGNWAQKQYDALMKKNNRQRIIDDDDDDDDEIEQRKRSSKITRSKK